MEFRDKLQQLRKQKNLTQEEVADMLFVSRTAISKWESGRGYPSIDSLKAISALFSVSIDNLLSGEELISLAEAENEEKTRTLHYLVFGILDCMMAILFFFPLFGQQGEGMIYNVSLLVLTGVPAYVRVPYILIVIITVIFGVAMLALQNLRHQIWLKINLATSISLSILGVLIFIISGQPYVAVFVFCMLIFKGILLIKQQ